MEKLHPIDASKGTLLESIKRDRTSFDLETLPFKDLNSWNKPCSLLQIKVCNFVLYRPIRAVHTGLPSYRYAYRPLPGGSVKNLPLTVDFGRRRPIEEEIDRRRSIEEEKGKKKRKRIKKEEGKKEYLARAPSTLACRCRPRFARGRGHFFSRARRRSVSPRGEKDRGD
ncbi:hypothetical protein BHE74_00054236, partial [Ensete ventricosum]